jgi:CHASE2 domain-containing sensor protein
VSGGILVIWLRSPLYLVLGTGIVIVILARVCLVLLLLGYWVPLIPSVIAIIGTESLVIVNIAVPAQVRRKRLLPRKT